MKSVPNAVEADASDPGMRPPWTILDRVGVGIALLARSGRFIETNLRMQQISGRSADQLARLDWAEIAHPDDAGHGRALLQQVEQGERTEARFEQRLLLPDGSWLWVSLIATPLRADAGRVDSLVLVVQDVTAEKLGEDALRGSELRFRRLIETLPAGAYTCDPEGLITYYNERAVELWGRAPKLNHPDDRWCGSFRLFSADGKPLAHAECWMARALRENRSYDGEEILIERPDGTRVVARAHASPLRDEQGQLIGSLNVLTDVTDRKRAEAMLLGSEERFARFMRHLPGLAWIKDLDGRYLFVNDAAEQAFRKPRALLYGKSDEEIFPAETSAQFRENDRKALHSASGIETVELLEHPDGMHHSLVSKFPIPGPDGAPALLGGIAIDITARIAAEEALREADRHKDEFLATLAHELRNPLAPLRNSLQLLRDADDAPEVCSMLERQVDQMVRLVDDLLEVSRISRGRVELRREPVLLADVLNAALETARPALAAGGHTLELALPDEPLALHADPLRLSQVFVNLIDNAAKYTPDGGHISLSAERRGGEVRVSLRDDGVGIPPELLPRIFEPFTQVSHTLPRAGGGLGIGLALVEQLVSMHGGRVEARSEGSGRGSEFVVELALRPEVAPARAESRPSSGGRPSHARVLVVDDNKDAADSLAMLLRARGLEADAVYDGRAALESVRERAPTAVLLDLGMPGMDGYEVARRLRADARGRDLLLVALTGWGHADVQSDCREAGFDHHLVKPVPLEALQALLALPPHPPAAHS